MGELRVNQTELDRQSALLQVERGEISMREAAAQLEISLRRLRRSRRRYETSGLRGLAHLSRGRPSGRALSALDLDAIKSLLNSRYSDFGATLAAENISLDLGRKISNETIRKIQIAEGLHRPKKRRKGCYHPRRKRRNRTGELVQSDGSIHHWLEDRGPPMTLITFIDDATSQILHAGFVPSESTISYMDLMKSYILAHGRPRALYVDKHSIFRQNQSGAYGRGDLTQFGRALRELDIELICANSPQAKGRVERGFGTLQDRLIKEMRLENISTQEEANKFLPGFLQEYNRRFGVEPKSAENAHRPLLPSQDLHSTLVIEEVRTLSKTLTFQYNSVLYQVCEPSLVNRLKNQKVKVTLDPSDEMRVVSRWGQHLRFVPHEDSVSELQRTMDCKDLGQLWVERTPKRKPQKHHPWR